MSADGAPSQTKQINMGTHTGPVAVCRPSRPPPSLLIGLGSIICCGLHQWEVKAPIVRAVSGQTASNHGAVISLPI